MVEAAAVYRASEIDEPALEERLARDIERGTTSLGPHLVDVSLRTSAGDLRSFGSQGQQRAAVLSLLLAEAACLAAAGRTPALLLDDVLSELDRDRRAGLVSLLGESTQTLVTATDPRRRARARPRGRGHARRREGDVSSRPRRMPQRLDEIMSGELERLGAEDRTLAVSRSWADAVGPDVARNAWPARVRRDGTLVVHARTSVWAFELNQMAEGDQGPPQPAPRERLRFVVGTVPEPVGRAGR